MKTTDFLTRTVLNGVAFETGMALRIAIAVVERGSLVKSSWGAHYSSVPQNLPISVADFISLAQVYKIPASELIGSIEVANITLQEKFKEIRPEFNGFIPDDVALAAISDTQNDNLHVEHSLQNLRTREEYIKASIDRLVEYCEFKYPSTPTVAGNAPSAEGEFRKSIG